LNGLWIQWLDQNTPAASGVRLISANYTAVAGDSLIDADATSGNIAVTLPDATAYSGYKLTILKNDSSANVVSLTTVGGQTVSGAASTTYQVAQQWQSVQLQSNGANWRIIAAG